MMLDITFPARVISVGGTFFAGAALRAVGEEEDADFLCDEPFADPALTEDFDLLLPGRAGVSSTP